ncbi:hypothetical protein [Leadbettera azotonutricia]|uniref:Uncharacterized protein n=1 Tax=Leadbettera azotonutricia (strain ATCC BAA-888 / DSM 13862 / ZAS-9) TaxID=545695 RepID=F5YG01_LEAAZ|nr:hypothetical protein [Leadbettera azotonutricia]AEF80778.1 hypothetical protein TREAZ_1305 [Leadbettera azotonutricia ZAS-9]
MAPNRNQSPEEFWLEYEKQIGEKVLAFSLGQYVSGWADEDSPFWGLLIATAGGFRFHHFPNENWISAAVRITRGGDGPKEVAMFIPKEKIVSVEIKAEKSFLKRLFFSRPPRLVIHYANDNGEEAVFVAEGDEKVRTIAEKLTALDALQITPS